MIYYLFPYIRPTTNKFSIETENFRRKSREKNKRAQITYNVDRHHQHWQLILKQAKRAPRGKQENNDRTSDWKRSIAEGL